MGRQRKLRLLVSSACCLAAFLSHSLPAEAANADASATAQAGQDEAEETAQSPERSLNPEEFRKRLEKLPPEQRERFRRNFERWKQMSPEEREKARIDQEGRARERLKDARKALKESGLKLEEKEEKVFLRRYIRERRQLEHRLLKEMEAKREQELQELIERLKQQQSTGQLTEFGGADAP